MSPTSYQAAPPRAGILPESGRLVKSLVLTRSPVYGGGGRSLPCRILVRLIAVEDLVLLHHVEALARDAFWQKRVLHGVLAAVVHLLRLLGESHLPGPEIRRLALQRP